MDVIRFPYPVTYRKRFAITRYERSSSLFTFSRYLRLSSSVVFSSARFGTFRHVSARFSTFQHAFRFDRSAR
jgi:hypothetical protein